MTPSQPTLTNSGEIYSGLVLKTQSGRNWKKKCVTLYSFLRGLNFSVWWNSIFKWRLQNNCRLYCFKYAVVQVYLCDSNRIFLSNFLSFGKQIILRNSLNVRVGKSLAFEHHILLTAYVFCEILNLGSFEPVCKYQQTHEKYFYTHKIKAKVTFKMRYHNLSIRKTLKPDPYLIKKSSSNQHNLKPLEIICQNFMYRICFFVRYSKL